MLRRVPRDVALLDFAKAHVGVHPVLVLADLPLHPRELPHVIVQGILEQRRTLMRQPPQKPVHELPPSGVAVMGDLCSLLDKAARHSHGRSGRGGDVRRGLVVLQQRQGRRRVLPVDDARLYAGREQRARQVLPGRGDDPQLRRTGGQCWYGHADARDHQCEAGDDDGRRVHETPCCAESVDAQKMFAWRGI